MREERITSRQNPLLRHVKKLLSSRSYRQQCGEYAGDGTKLLEEALRWDAGVKTIVAAENVTLPPVPDTVRVARVPMDVMESVSQMQTPQGAIFLCDLPQPEPLHLTGSCLILDGIQDPGNVGTILRTAEGAGADGIILNRASVDLYNPKTIRSTMGSVYRMPFLYVEEIEEILPELKRRNIRTYAAHLKGKNCYDEEDYRTGTAFFIGNEGNGLSERLSCMADVRIRIPMEGSLESLNAAVAASILMYEVNRQRRS